MKIPIFQTKDRQFTGSGLTKPRSRFRSSEKSLVTDRTRLYSDLALPVGVLLLSLALLSCTQLRQSTAKSMTTPTIVFADVESGQARIVRDSMDGFFESIGILDMQIQLHGRPTCDGFDRCSTAYKAALKSDVLSFQEHEKEKLQGALDRALALCPNLVLKGLPEEIVLIKMAGMQYGDGAFYTRENCILIPEAQMTAPATAMENVLLHELFHIFSRYNPKWRDRLYELIGFRPIHDFRCEMPAALVQRRLLNPDGVDWQFAIQLKDSLDDRQIMAVPMVASNQEAFRTSVPDFFSYIQFDLFEVGIDSDGCSVIADAKGETTLDQRFYLSFFEQIADNTQYIIHPDEILADNFVLLCRRMPTNDFSELSDGGQDLLKRIHQLLSTE